MLLVLSIQISVFETGQLASFKGKRDTILIIEKIVLASTVLFLLTWLILAWHDSKDETALAFDMHSSAFDQTVAVFFLIDSIGFMITDTMVYCVIRDKERVMTLEQARSFKSEKGALFVVLIFFQISYLARYTYD